MLLLHLSDIHFQAPQCHTEEDPELHFRQELLAHTAAQVSELGDVDAILVSGDIAYKGIREEYEAAAIWFKLLAAKVGCKKNRIYVIPGNHDVDWTKLKGAARNAARAISGAGDDFARERELNAQLAEQDSGENLFASIEAYNIFASKYDCASNPNRLRWTQELKIDSRTVLKLHGLNTTLISGVDNNDQTPGKLFMGPRQLNVSRESGTVNLIMAHHPPEWMTDMDSIVARTQGAPNIVMFGHKHLQKIHRDVNGPIVFSAGSVNPERHVTGWSPAYNFIELNSGDGHGQRPVNIRVHQYRWQAIPAGFVATIDLVTGLSYFDHALMINGDNVREIEIPTNTIVAGGESMPIETNAGEEEGTLSSPNIRDLIYRFWELSSTDRLQVLKSLNLDLGKDKSAMETMAYRKALVEIAGQNKLAELEDAIAHKEAKE